MVRYDRRRLWVGLLVIVAASGLALVPLVFAQETAQEQEETAAKDKTEDDATEDRYAVPKTEDSAELLKFIEGIRQFQPQSAEEFLEHRRKAPEAIKTAAERIVQLESDKSSEAYKEAENLLLLIRVVNIANAPGKQQEQTLAELAQRLKSDPADGQNLSFAMSAARVLEQSGNSKLASSAYHRFAEALEGAEDPQLSRYAQLMSGSARRLGLVGNPMQLTGKTFEGAPFDWKSYRGKVVLVDFWATWCGPCREELPNIQKNYQLYHDRGFDVVGISLDQDREALKQFLEESPLPWTTLHEEEGEQPSATYYGITAIPTTILVDRAGAVVSLHARGPELGRLLARLIGPPEPADQKAGAKPDTGG